VLPLGPSRATWDGETKFPAGSDLRQPPPTFGSARVKLRFAGCHRNPRVTLGEFSPIRTLCLLMKLHRAVGILGIGRLLILLGVGIGQLVDQLWVLLTASTIGRLFIQSVFKSDAPLRETRVRAATIAASNFTCSSSGARSTSSPRRGSHNIDLLPPVNILLDQVIDFAVKATLRLTFVLWHDLTVHYHRLPSRPFVHSWRVFFFAANHCAITPAASCDPLSLDVALLPSYLVLSVGQCSLGLVER
jgi:hypothetical protein